MSETINKKLIFVCSQLRGDIENNIKEAKRYCRHLMFKNKDVIAFAPHVYFTSFLDDNDEYERNLGIVSGLKMLEICEEIAVFCEGGTQQNPIGLSEGMLKEIYHANNDLGIKKIRYFDKNTLEELPNNVK